MIISDDNSECRPRKVCLGTIVGSQGLKGAVRIRSYTANPEDIGSYGLLSDKTGKSEFRIRVLKSTKKGIIAELSGIRDRSASDEIKGLELFVERIVLPELEDGEFYFSDLIGLDVEKEDGQSIGRIKSMNNFGAGDVVEVVLFGGETLILPFTHETVPVIDVEGARVVVNVPTEAGADDAYSFGGIQK